MSGELNRIRSVDRWPITALVDGEATTLVAVKTQFEPAIQAVVITTEDGRRWAHRARQDFVHVPAPEPQA